MKLSSIDLNSRGFRVFDCEDKLIPNVYFYDTVTKEISLYIKICENNSSSFIAGKSQFLTEPRNSDNPGLKLVTFILEGSYAVNKDGVKV